MENKSKLFETERLILRRLELTDAEDMFNNYCGSDIVTEYLSWNTHGSIQDTKDYLEKVVMPNYEDGSSYYWAIVLKETNQVIGSIEAFKIDESNKSIMLGWVLGEKFWGQGLMPEAARVVRDYLFSEGFVRIWAYHNIENKKSGRVMQKIDMLHEGTLKKYSKDKNGNFIDCDVYAITK
jgi:ribosomal-protein-alanine N-acetyltransferase